MDRQSFEAFQRDRTAAQDAEWHNLAFALHHKRGAALTASEKTLMETEPAHPDPNALAILGEVAPNLKLFEEKLDQFPAGTRFKLQHVSCPDQHSQNVLEAGLPELFLKHGMKLVTPDEPTTAAQ
jgi:hypothetical protein